MKVEFKTSPESILLLNQVLTDVCNSHPLTTLEKVNKCVLTDVYKMVDSKARDLKIKQTALFNNKKQVKLSFKISQAYYLYKFLSDIEIFTDTHVKFHIQKIINLLDQKLC